MKNNSAKTPMDDDELIVDLVAEVADEFIQRIEQGEDPSIEDYAQRHPEAAVIIRRTLGALKTMRTVDLWEVGKNDDPNADIPQHTIGDFKLIRVVGRGGMGVVYEAEQLSLHRRVALKVLPYAAMLDERALQRFRNEVRAAASLDHPNIVPVHGVGYESGVHHYAMRMIEGVTLAEIIDQLSDLRKKQQDFPDSIGSLSSEAPASQAIVTEDGPGASTGSTVVMEGASETAVNRKRKTAADSQSWKNVRQPASHFRSVAMLAVKVAEALDHAHHHGIVHRDVKPSNILLDATGKPWVADFGLAQVETGTALTMTGDVLGTARYMSPEQVLANRVILDHRTDVYSLGVTLYELLALELPYAGDDRRELFRQIAFEDPKRLCRVNPSIPADLATVVMKAMEKNPDDRYQTAQCFAEDLHRFTQNQPIVAYPPRLLKRTSKWMARHSTFSWAVAIILLIVAITSSTAAVIVSGAYQQERTSRQRADELYKNNLKLSHQAKQAIDQYVATVDNDTLLQDPAASELRNELLGFAREYYGALVESLRNSESKFELAESMLQLEALTAESVGLDESVDLMHEVIALLSENQFSPDERGRSHGLLAQAFNRLSVRFEKMGNRPENEAASQAAIKYARQAWQADPENGDHQRTLAMTLGNKGIFLGNWGDRENALPYLQESIEMNRQFLVKDPNNTIHQHSLANYLLNIDGGEGIGEATEIAIGLEQENSQSPEAIHLLARCYISQSDRYSGADERDRKREALEKANLWAEKLFALRPHNMVFREYLGRCQKAFGDFFAGEGDLDKAIEYFDKAIANYELVTGSGPKFRKASQYLAKSLFRVGSILATKKKHSSARDYMNKSVRLSQQLIDVDPANLGYRHDAILTKVMITQLDLENGDATSASVELESASQLFPDFGNKGPSHPQSKFLLAMVNRLLGEVAFYRGDWEESLARFSLALEYARPIHREGNHEDDYLIAVYCSGIIDSLIKLQAYDVVQSKLAGYVEEFQNVDMFALAARVRFELLELGQAGDVEMISNAKATKLAIEVADRAIELVLQENNTYVLGESFLDLSMRQAPASIAERVYQQAKEKFRDGEDGQIPWELVIASLRAGKPEECLAKLETHSIAPHEVGFSDLNKVLVKAIAHQHLGENEEARRWLSKAEAIVSSSDYLSRVSQQWLSQARVVVNK